MLSQKCGAPADAGEHKTPPFLRVKFVLVSTLPHWGWQPSVRAGPTPAAACKSRPSQGQAEPLCYPSLPSTRFPHTSFLGVLFVFSLTATPAFSNLCCALWFLPLFWFSHWKAKQWRREEKNPLLPLAALGATYNAEPLSKLLSFPLPLSFPATVGKELSAFFSFSSPCLALPLPQVLFSVSFQHLRGNRKSLGTADCCLQNGELSIFIPNREVKCDSSVFMHFAHTQ